MKMIFTIVFFSVCCLSYQKNAYSYEFTATITDSYEYYNSVSGEFYEGEIRRDGWHVGDSFSGSFSYDTFDHNGDGIGGEESAMGFLDRYLSNGRITITNDQIDTFTLYVSYFLYASAGEYATLTITDPTGTLVAGNSDEGLPNSLNMTNSTLFDVSVEYSQIYDGPADWRERMHMSAVVHIQPVPLPSVLLLFGSGLAGLIVVSRSGRKDGRSDQRAIVSNIRPG